MQLLRSALEACDESIVRPGFGSQAEAAKAWQAFDTVMQPSSETTTGRKPSTVIIVGIPQSSTLSFCLVICEWLGADVGAMFSERRQMMPGKRFGQGRSLLRWQLLSACHRLSMDRKQRHHSQMSAAQRYDSQLLQLEMKTRELGRHPLPARTWTTTCCSCSR